MSRRAGISIIFLYLWLGAALGPNAIPYRGTASFVDQHAMGDAPCAWSEPVQKADHSLDIPKTIELLKQGGFTCHAMPITAGPPFSWAELQQLVAAADAARIDAWAVLIPPTEGSSALYKHNFVAWMEALANLSIRYPHLRGANIGLAASLQQAQNAAAARFPVYGGVYTHWTSWHKQGPRTTSVFEQTLQQRCELADGASYGRSHSSLRIPCFKSREPSLAAALVQ